MPQFRFHFHLATHEGLTRTSYLDHPIENPLSSTREASIDFAGAHWRLQLTSKEKKYRQIGYKRFDK